MFAIVIHGGAGVRPQNELTKEDEKKYIEGLEEALDSGYQVLAGKGPAIEAVQAAVVSLENNELFNAGKGSVFTSDGTHEMEASIMCGRRIDAGAVSGIKNVRNPVLLARMVLEKSNHLYLSGTGAEQFARENGLQFENDDYFYSRYRFLQLQSAKMKNKGTVGAVAVDSMGDLAAATSTGGLTNKKYGRIGDSPIIGAGTYANNLQCAVSCTGDGEYFIRSVAAFDVYAMMQYKGLTLQDSLDSVIMQKLRDIGGEGGAIGVDRDGNMAMVFNSDGMYRACRKEGSPAAIYIY
jgi:beta-aspartyl-peptidase (threonine type)